MSQRLTATAVVDDEGRMLEVKMQGDGLWKQKKIMQVQISPKETNVLVLFIGVMQIMQKMEEIISRHSKVFSSAL